MDKNNLLILLALSGVGITTHLLPHAFGFTTVGAISLLAAAYLPRHLLPLPVIFTVLAADLVIGGYALASMIIVYLAHIMAAVAIHPLSRHRKVAGLAAGGVVNALVFYLVSNLSPMVAGYYPATFDGLVLCYTMALPYLAKGIVANLVFGGLAFGAICLVQQLLATERRISH